MFDFVLFGNQFNTETVVLMFVVWLIGLFVGWCFRNMNPFMIILCFIVLGQVVGLIISINIWILNVPFALGFLVHTYKPIMYKLRSLR